MSRTRDYIDQFYDYDIMIPTRTLYMGSISDVDGDESGTNYEMAERVIKGLHILDAKPDSPITIIMNNIGGDIYHGFGAIYDTIKSCQNKVIIVVRGHAMSMGSIILQAADERIISPNSRMMLHYGQMNIDNETQNAYAWVEDGKKIDKLMEDIYLEKIKQKHPNFSRKKLKEMLKHDCILTAKEAVDLGLADIVEGE